MADYDISVEIDPNGARRGRRQVEAELNAIDRAAQRLKSSIGAALAFAGLGVGVAALVQYADAYTNINNRVRTVTASQAEAVVVMNQLYDVAQRTRQSWQGTAELYSRVALAARELGINQKEVLRFTESLNKAVILSGASSQEASAGLIQLSQGLASGTLRGDELRSVLEQLPAVADVIAKSLGVTRGELRKLGEDGKITALQVIDAFREAATDLDQRFANTLPTIGQGFQILQNAVTKYVGEVTTGTGAQSALANGMIALANNIENVTRVLMVLAAFFITRWIAGALVAGLAATRAYVAGTVALEIALGATTVRAATASAGMKILQGVMMTLTSTAAVLTASLFLLGGGIIYMINESYNAQAALDSLDGSGMAAQSGLMELQDKARAAGIDLGNLSTAGNTASPIMYALATAYDAASAAALRLASSARAAAIAVAQGEITKLKAQQIALGSETEKGVQRGNIFSGLKYTAQGIAGELGLGPTYGERQAGVRQAQGQIGTYEQQIKALQGLTDGQFDEMMKPSPRAAAGGGDDKKKKRGGGGKSEADIIAEFNDRIADETELVGLSGAAHDKRAAIISLENQLNRGLTDSEREAAGAILDKLQAAKDVALFKEYSDSMKQEIALLGMSNRERERAEEIYRLENELKRDLTVTEKALVDARLDELQAAKDGKYLKEVTDDLERENLILRTNVEQRAIRAQILRMEADLGRELTPIERQRVESLLAENEALDRQNQLYEDMTSSTREVAQRRADLNALYEQGRIGLEEYNRALYDLRLDEITDKMDKGTASMAEGFIGELARMSEAARNWKGTTGQIFGEFFSEFSQGVGDSIGRAIVFSEDLGASLLDVARNAVSSLISSLIQLGLQILINKVVMKAFGAETTATSAVQGAAVAAAWAPAAAFVSLATFGANAGAAIGGIALTLAATKAMGSIVQAFADGGYVTGAGGPRDDSILARLSNGEFVVNAQATRENRATLEAINSGRSVSVGSSRNAGDSTSAPGFSVSVGDIHVTMPAGTTPDQAGAVGREVREQIRSITREELRKQSRDGGALTKTRSSTMTS